MELARYVKFRDERFGGVLFETQGEKVFALNKTAAAILHELLAGHETETIAEHLKDQFRGPATTIAQDVASLIGQLHTKGLIVQSQP